MEPAPETRPPVAVLRWRFAFTPAEEDVNGHVNNIEYVRKMQEISIMHIGRNGWGMDKLLAGRHTWVVREHRIEYLHSCRAGEPIALYTWVHDFQRIRSHRRYRFVRESDGAVLARAETEWVFFDLDRQRPTSVPEEFLAIFPAIGEAAEAQIGTDAVGDP